MTLFRSLLRQQVLLFIMFTLLFWGLMFSSMRTYISGQQQTATANAVHSLGLALVPYLANGDRVGAESVLKAAFDGGNYDEIRLSFLSAADPVILRQQDEITGLVPQWFFRLPLFEPLQQEQELTAGWLQLGKLQVQAASQQPYQELWRLSLRLLSGVSVLMLLTGLLLAKTLRKQLQPVDALRVRAESVAQRRFADVPLPLPPSQDLRALTQAFNLMEEEIARAFQEQSQAVAVLHREAYEDVTTGLANRRWFRQQLETAVTEHTGGVLFLLELDVLSTQYETTQNQMADKLAYQLALAIRQFLSGRPEVLLGRTRLAEFAVWYPGLGVRSDLRQAEEVAAQLLNVIRLHVSDVVEPREMSDAFLGGVVSDGYHAAHTLLATADMALHRAKKEIGQFYLHTGSFQPVLQGKQEWRPAVLAALADPQAIQVVLQPVFGEQGKVLHQEAFVRLRLNSQWVTAADWLPMVEAIGLASAVDLVVIQHIRQMSYTGTVAINLSNSSIYHNEFSHQLAQILSPSKSSASKEKDAGDKFEIIFELSEAGLLSNPAASLQFVNTLTAQGWRWGLDQFGRSSNGTSYLAQFTPEYVKLDYGYTHTAEDGPASKVIAALCRLIHQRTRYAIATRVENKVQWDHLAGLGVNGFQGFGMQPLMDGRTNSELSGVVVNLHSVDSTDRVH